MKRLFVAVGAAIAIAIALLSAQTPAPQPAGRVSDNAVVQALLKQFNVPGVSIAVIKDFKVRRRTPMASRTSRPARR